MLFALFINMLKSLSFIIIFFLTFPVSAQTYTYTNSRSCEYKSGENFKIRSPLSGHAVGPHITLQSLNDKILRPFTSDGCSRAFDGIGWSEEKKWTPCCVAHDVEYWMGGSEKQKQQSDENFAQCIIQKGYPKISPLYKFFVHHFGGPEGSQIYRWGYGWNYNRPFANLSSEEIKQAEDLYGEKLPRLKKRLSQTQQLTYPCDTYDYGLEPAHKAEQKIYQHLNANLASLTIIEWAERGAAASRRTEYIIKLQNCQTPIQILTAENGDIIELQNQTTSCF